MQFRGSKYLGQLTTLLILLASMSCSTVSAYTLTSSPFLFGPSIGSENCDLNITAMVTDGKTADQGTMIFGGESYYADDGTCDSKKRAFVAS